MADISLNCGGYSTFSMLQGVFSVFLSEMMSDVLRENGGHGVQNVGHV